MATVAIGQITLVARGDPEDPQSVAGKKAVALRAALARRYEVTGISDARMGRASWFTCAALAFRPSKWRWRQRLYLSPHSFRAQSRAARRSLRRLSPEGQTLPLQFNAMFRISGRPGVVYVDTTFHLTDTHAPEEIPLTERERAAWLREERRTYSDALHVFTMHEQAAESLRAFYGLPPERVSVVLAGSNSPLAPPRQRREPGSRVLFVGRDAARKGLPELLEAFARLREKRVGARLDVVGPEPAGSEDGVHWHGYVTDRERLNELYKAADVFCLPSRWEPTGLAPLEAMAHGVPCVVSDVGGLPEMVLAGETGLVVPPRDVEAIYSSLLELLEQPDLSHRMGEAGRQRVARELTWDRVADRMSPVLDRLLAAAGR